MFVLNTKGNRSEFGHQALGVGLLQTKQNRMCKTEELKNVMKSVVLVSFVRKVGRGLIL